jgi:hypothetical protein
MTSDWLSPRSFAPTAHDRQGRRAGPALAGDLLVGVRPDLATAGELPGGRFPETLQPNTKQSAAVAKNLAVVFVVQPFIPLRLLSVVFVQHRDRARVTARISSSIDT